MAEALRVRLAHFWCKGHGRSGPARWLFGTWSGARPWGSPSEPPRRSPDACRLHEPLERPDKRVLAGGDVPQRVAARPEPRRPHGDLVEPPPPRPGRPRLGGGLPPGHAPPPPAPAEAV